MTACLIGIVLSGRAQAAREPVREASASPVFDITGLSDRPSGEAEIKLEYFLSINGFSSASRPAFLPSPTVAEPPGRNAWYHGSFRGSAPFYLRVTRTERPLFTDYHGEVTWPPDADPDRMAAAEFAAEIRKLDDSTLEQYGRSVIPLHIALTESQVVLLAPPGWRLEPYWNLSGIAPLEKTKPSLRRMIHLQRVVGSPQSLQEAIEAELDRITQISGARGSYNDRRSYKGSMPVKTASGLEGVHAMFWSDGPKGPRYFVEKYYFFDSNHHVFKVCAHIYGGQAEYERFEKAILDGLYLQSTPPAEPAPKSDGR